MCLSLVVTAGEEEAKGVGRTTGLAGGGGGARGVFLWTTSIHEPATHAVGPAIATGRVCVGTGGGGGQRDHGPASSSTSTAFSSQGRLPSREQAVNQPVVVAVAVAVA